MMSNWTPHFRWLVIAAVAAVALLSIGPAWGQGGGAATAFEGRPSMAGAQAGQGAMAGPPQGGLGVQGDANQRNLLDLRKPSGLDAAPAAPGPRDAGMAAADPVQPGDKVSPLPKRERGLAKDNRSTVKKAKRAGKRTIERARHGSSGIDSGAPVSVPAR